MAEFVESEFLTQTVNLWRMVSEGPNPCPGSLYKVCQRKVVHFYEAS